MHVGARRVALAGVLVAFTAIMMVLGSIIESSTLFFIGAASFCVGIAVREWGLRFGVGFWIAVILINIMVAPNKLYCITLGGMGFYIWMSELLWERIAAAQTLKRRHVVLWIGKYVIFNAMYIPALFFMPKLIFTGKINGLAAVTFLIIGQAVFFVYDRAYVYFQGYIWGKIRVKVMGKEYE